MSEWRHARASVRDLKGSAQWVEVPISRASQVARAKELDGGMNISDLFIGQQQESVAIGGLLQSSLRLEKECSLVC